MKTFSEYINERKAKLPKKFWDTMYATQVIDAYKKGDLNLDNIEEWETNYNNGVKPSHSMGGKEILAYHIETGKDPRD